MDSSTISPRPDNAAPSDGWAELISDFYRAKIAAGASPVSLSVRVSRLRTLATRGDLGRPETVSPASLDASISALGLAPSTERNTRRAVRVLLSWALENGRIPSNPAHSLPTTVFASSAPSTHRPIRSGPTREAFPQPWRSDVDAWTRQLITSGAAPGTIDAHLWRLRAFAQWSTVPPREVTGFDLVMYASSNKWATETRRGFRATVRTYYAWAHKHLDYPSNPAEDLPSIRPGTTIPRVVSDSAIMDTLAGCTARTSLVVRLAAFMGLRRAEIAGIHARDVVVDGGSASLVVHGKGRKERIVPIPTSVHHDLVSFSGFLFPSPTGGHLDPSTLGRAVNRELPRGASLHGLRHRFATKVYESSSDLIATQSLLGHSKPETTRRYVSYNNAGLRDLVSSVDSIATRPGEIPPTARAARYAL